MKGFQGKNEQSISIQTLFATTVGCAERGFFSIDMVGEFGNLPFQMLYESTEIMEKKPSTKCWLIYFPICYDTKNAAFT